MVNLFHRSNFYKRRASEGIEFKTQQTGGEFGLLLLLPSACTVEKHTTTKGNNSQAVFEHEQAMLNVLLPFKLFVSRPKKYGPRE